MNYQILLLRLRHKTLIAIIILCAVLAGTLAIAFDKRTLAVGEGERVVTVYDGDNKLTYITSADTVEEALKRGSIDVSEQDAVEPALDSKLIDRNYKINVYRARPVLVVDGETRTTVVTAQKSARQVVESAGVELYDEDEADVTRIDDVVADGAVAQKIVVDRSTPINLNLYGKTDKVRTQAETVGELIEEKGIVMGEKDGVSLPLSTAITANMTVKVWRDGVQTITQEEDIQFEIEQIQDTAREVGYKQIKEAGALGKKNVTYEIEMKNGEVVSRKAIQTVVLKEAKKQVEIIGARPGNGLTMSMGVNHFQDSKGVIHRETYYDLPMQGVMGYCGGTYSVRNDGVKIDQDGYVIVAANLGRYSRCSIVETSLGLGKVYDTGGFAAVHPDGFDLATDWTNNNGE